MVQRSTVIPYEVTPVTVDLAEFMLVIVPGPLIFVQDPVPGAAVLPSSVNVLLSQLNWSLPAAAAGALVRVTSS